MPTSTTIEPPVVVSPKLQGLRNEVKQELAGDNFKKYSVSALLNSIKALAARGRKYEDEGDYGESYKMYFKAAELFSVVINHKEYQESQKQRGAIFQVVNTFQQSLHDTVIAPAHRVSDRLKAMEPSKADKAEWRDTPILPGSPLPFTLPPTPPASSGPGSVPSSPVPNAATRSIADRMSMLRENGLKDGTPRGGPASLPAVNGKRLSQQSHQSTSSVSSSSPVASPAPHLPLSHTSSSHNLSSMFGSLSILEESSSSRSLAALQEHSPSPPPREPTPPSAHIQTESEFNNAFPSLSKLEASFPILPSVPTGLPGLPSVPTARPGRSPSAPIPPPRHHDLSASTSPSLKLSMSPPRRPSPPPIPPKPAPLSPHSSGSRPQAAPPGRPRTASPLPPQSSGGSVPFIHTAITPRELHGYLVNDSEAILLLDVRDGSAHRACHIACPPSGHSRTVQVEPFVLERSSLTSASLESALVLSAESAEAFSKRAAFSYIVMYDDSSSNVGYSQAMRKLVRLIYEQEFDEKKRLDQPPIVLVGGLKAWKAAFGDEGLEGDDVRQEARSRAPSDHTGGRQDLRRESDRLPTITPRPPISDRERIEALRDERGRSSLDQLPNRIWHPPASPTLDDTSPVALARKPAISRSQGITKLSSISGDLAGYAGGAYSSNSPTSPTNHSPQYQSLYTNYPANGSSYRVDALPGGAALPTPPQASAVPPTYMSRRRSDYAEQSQFSYSGAPPSSRPTIDYPQLNVNAAPIITPPPAVASSSLERYDPRQIPPRPGTQYTQQYTLPTGTEPISYPGRQNGHAPGTKLMPPKIHSDWPVQFWADQAISASGLKNLGNTCYMNSTLQCLSATIPFSRFFLENRWQRAVNTVNPLGTKGHLAGAFAKILHEMWQAQYSYLSPVNFRRSACQYARQFAGSDQHDSQEFLSFLLDGLHEDLNRVLEKPPADDPTPEREAELESLPQQIAGEQEWRVYQQRNDSIIVDYFQGQFRNRMQCLTCLKTSTTYNAFMYLSLPIPTGRGVTKVSLQQCLDTFVKEEIMEKADAWHCPNCKVLRKATKRLSISRLPPVLLIHLKRFSTKGPFTDKLETLVDFPLKGLDLTNYMPPPLPPGAERARADALTPVRLDDPRAQVPPYKYDLYAVTNHMGSLSNGHYTAYLASKGSWVYADDSRLTNAEGREIVAKPAYILFYKRVPR